MAGLRIEDVDLQAGTARGHQQVRRNTITHGLEVAPLKTYASADDVELIPAVRAVLADAVGDRTEGYVWESTSGRPYWPARVTHGSTAALKRAGLPHVRLHDLRHYFIGFLPQLDVHPSVAQQLARHATIGTTMNTYTSIENGLKKQAMGKRHHALENATGQPTGLPEGKKLRAAR